MSEEAKSKPEEIKPKRRGSLRTKVALRFLLVAVIPVFAMGSLAVYLVDSASQRMASELEIQLVRAKSEEIGRFFEEITGVFDLRLSRDSKQNIESGGVQTIYGIEAVPSGQRKFLLEGILSSSTAIEDAMFFDMSGQEIDRVDKIEKDRSGEPPMDASRLERFTQPKAGKAYVSPARTTLQGPVVTVSYPVKNASDDIVGVVSGDVSLNGLTRIISTGKLGASGYLILVTDSGELLANSGQSSDAGNNVKIDSVAYVRKLVEVRSEIGGMNAETYTSAWNQPVIGYGERVRGQAYLLVAEWPVDDAFNLTRTLLWQVMIFTAFVIVTVFAISLLIARGITKPVRRLQALAKRIGDGEFDNLETVKTGDEIEDLDVALHDMAKALKLLQELREEFVFIAAHELRAPVTAIKGYISMVLEDHAATLSDDVKEMLDRVQKANQHLVQLVQDLLEVARSDAGRMKLEMTPEDLGVIIKTAISDLKPLWNEKKLSVEYAEPQVALPKVLGDGDKLREIIVNLLSNGIKYNRDGGTISISHSVAESKVVTSIADSGIGMTQEEVLKLFGKFYRAENADTRKVQGTGLGLFIVKQLVEKMGGRIWVESERGKGSCFFIELPAVQA
jgi:signal transduction histidine kinase